jgi:hypothetical protein
MTPGRGTEVDSHPETANNRNYLCSREEEQSYTELIKLWLGFVDHG